MKQPTRQTFRPTRTLALVSATNLVAASSIYWTQSMMPTMKAEFGATALVGLLPGATLIGYAIGVAILALASRDLTSKRGFASHALVLVVGLAIVAAAPNAATATFGCVMIGSGCAITQRLLIMATMTGDRSHRSEAIAVTIASGLVGIVIARAFVGEIAMTVGWRTVLVSDAGIIIALMALVSVALPRSTHQKPQRSTSALALWRRHPVLRNAACQQAVAFAAFNAGWALLPALAQTSPGTRAGIAGIGAATVLASIRFVKQHQRRGASNAALGLIGCAALMALCIRATPGVLGAMALLEIGTQLALVANQTRAQGIVDDVGDRGRIASMVTAIGFTGGALGAAIVNISVN